jgi:hypothetical protein
MSKYLPLPDGNSVTIREGESAAQAWERAKQMYPASFGFAEEKKADEGPGPQGGFMASLKAGTSGLKSDVAALAGKAGLMDEDAAQKYIEEQKKYQAKTFKPTEEGWSEAPLTKVKELLGGSLPYMVAPVVAGAVAPAGAAALGATGVASLAQFTGSNLSRQMDEGKTLKETELGSAAAAAIPQAALDVVSLKMLPGVRGIFGQAGKNVPAAAAKEFAEKGVAKIAGDYALATGKAMTAEGLTEAGQQFFERMQAGLDLTDAKARDEYWESLVGGAVLGGTIAPAGRYFERGSEKSKLEVQRRKEADDLATQQREAARVAKEQEAAAEAQAEAERKADPAYASQFLTDYETRLAAFQGINTKKLGKDATFEEREILKENKAQKEELGKQLAADTQEYRRLKALRAAAQNAPDQAEMFPETRGGQAPGAQQVVQDEQQRALYGQQPAIQVPAAPTGMTAQPALPETVPDYQQQARALKTQIEPLQTQMQQTSDLNQKLALGKQLTDINSSIAEAEKAAKKQGKSPQDQIKALAYQMSAAEINGDYEGQINIAQKLLALGVTDLSKLPQAFDLKATKKQFSETQAEFDTRAGEAIASGREENRAQQNKITAEVAKLGKIGENFQPAGEEYARDARQERQTQNEVLKMEDQAAMNKGQTAQYTLFGGEELSSDQRSGTGALSTNSRARLQAALQIAQATGNRQAVSDAVAALKDLKAQEEAQAGAKDQTYNFAELEKASGQKMPANVAAQQDAADARDTAYANVVDLVAKYNQGKAKKEALDKARDFLIENLAKDIETSRDKPLTTAEQLQVQDQANKLLDELIGRFGDTRNVSSVGTKRDPAFQPAQELTNELQVTTKTSENGNVTKTYVGYTDRDGTPISVSIVRRPDGSIFRMFIKDLQNGKQFELSPGYGPGVPDSKIIAGIAEAGDWEKTPRYEFNKDKVPGQGYFTAESKGPGYRTFASPYAAAMSIQEGLDSIRNKGVEGSLGATAAEVTLTPKETTPEMVRNQLDRLLSQAPDKTDPEVRKTAVEIADNLKALGSSLDVISEYLSNPTPERTREVKAVLAASELGKRSETEGGKTAIQEELPGVEAAGTVFGSQKEFDDYLASDALVQLRKDQGLVTQTVSRLKAIAAPFAKKAEGLRAQLATLQARYAASQKVSADEVDLAKAMSAEAKANLKAVIDRLDAELHGLQADYIQANTAFNFSVSNAEEISANIEANARDYTEPQRKALSDYRKAKRALSNAAKLGPTPDHPKAKVQTWAFERGPKERYTAKLASLQVEVVRATQAYRAAVARSQTQQSIVKFLDADLNLQMQLQNELAEMDRAGEDMLNAGVALELAKQKQDRSYKNKAAIKNATSDVNAAMQIEQEALAVAQEKKNLELAQMQATQRELADAEKEADKADTVAERQRKQRERDNEALYTETIYDREARDREERRLDNESKERLAAIPGQRLDFSKRREMLDVVDSSREAEDQINFNIEDANRALDQIAKNIELQQTAIEDSEAIISVLKPKKRLGPKQKVDLENAEFKLQNAQAALEKSKQSKQVFERAIARSESALTRLNKRVEEISKAFSNDAEVQKKVQASAKRRITSREKQVDKLSQRLNDIRDDEANRPERTKLRHEIAKKKREIRSITSQVEGERGLTRTVLRMPESTVARLEDIADNTSLPAEVRAAAEAKLKLQADLDEEQSLTPAPKTTKEDESQEAVDARKAVGKRKIGPVVKDIRTGKTSQAGTVKGPTGKQALKQTIKGDELRQAFARIEYLDDLYESTQAALDRATDPEKIAKFTSNLSSIEAERNKVEARTEGFTPIGVGTDATEATSSVQTILNEDGQEALADGRTLDVLRNIIATTDVPFIRENAEKLLGFVSRTRIMYAPDITVKGEAVPAAYNAQENAVGVRPGFESESNVIHELTHAATMRALEGPENKLNADQLAAKREITGIYNRLTANGTLTGQYAAKNVKEFVSEVQSNADLRAKLGSTKMFGSTALRKLVDAFLRLIGMNPSYVKTEEAQAVIERLYMQSGKLENVETSPIIFSKTQPKYESENDLTRLANQVIAQPKAFKDRFVNHAALKAEMETVDMRAGLREALKTGDTKNYQQAMYSVTKADQKMAVTYSTLQNGAPELYTDEKGFHGIKSERRGDKPTAVNIFEAVSRVPGENEQAKMALATTYMIAQRAANKGLTKLDLGNLGVTEEQLAEAMAFVNSNAAYKNSLENVREKYNKYNAGLIKFLADTGAIPKKMADEFLKDGDYVPYYRVREDGVAELVFGGEKTVTIGDIRHQPYLAELKGGDTKILPLSESLPRNTMLLMDKALTNMATKNVAYAMQDIGKGKGPIDEKTGKPKNLMPIHSGRNPGGASVIVFNQEPDPKDPKDDGQRWLRVETDGTIMGGIPAELVVKSLEGAHLTLPSFLKLGGMAGDLLRSGVTRTPLYIMRQLIRDPMAATFTSGLNYGPLSAIYKATKEFVKMQSGNSVTAGKLIEKGLIQSQIFNGDPDDLSKFALQLASGKDQGAMDALFAMADRAAMSADAATRSLVYENAIKNGLSEVEADMMVMESMNFNKRGLSPTVQYASRLIPFFNAQIQGLNVLYKAATGNMPFNEQQRIKQKFYNNGMMLMATGLVYAMAMQDDEYYKNAKPKDRYSNFFLYVPGVKEPLKIPIPYEAGWFFSAAVATVDAIVGEVDTKQQLTAIRDMFLGSIPGYSSAGMPQIIKPVFEVWTNKNFFSGNNIESVGMQNKRTEDRYVAATTEMAKAMSRVAPILSPVQIEHIVRGYLGVMPIAAMAATNDLFAKESAVEKPERRLTDVPLIGSAFQRQYGGADQDVVYKLAQDAMETNTSFNTLKRTGNLEDVRAFREEHMAELRAAPIAGAYKQNMARLKLQEDLITNRLNLSPTEKRARIDNIDQARQDLSEKFMKRIKEIENLP